MRILHVVGARPNFIKVAPVYRALAARGTAQTLLHTGQHYDDRMSGAIFRDLGLPLPEVNLGVGSGSHAQQTGQVMLLVEQYLQEHRPELVVVYGDVNSTMAATIVAAKLGIQVAHVEAGLRSHDLSMPEEINRLVTDCLSSWHFTPSKDGDDNLLREGTDPSSIHRVGNVMIDTLIRLLPEADSSALLRQFQLLNGTGVKPYVLVTLHRPSNVDDPVMLPRLLEAFAKVATRVPVIFPVHPRTRQRMAASHITLRNVTLTDPLGYLEFLGLQQHASVVVTDSGGVQEETTFLGVPCLTMRENTERPVTVTEGTNMLVGRDTNRLQAEIANILDGRSKQGRVPDLWDGRAAERIASCVGQLEPVLQ